ncbi:hypothetical protein [Rhodococcus sp. HM1]|nr:hypothetical protein [Rhodococcus sp. HM1]
MTDPTIAQTLPNQLGRPGDILAGHMSGDESGGSSDYPKAVA